MSLEREFVPCQEALELKELGFNEPCFRYYHTDKTLRTQTEGWLNEKCTAPTYSQAFRFFRGKYRLHSGIVPYYDYYYYSIKDFINDREYDNNDEQNSYEETELECLKKLIEIVKNK